MFVGLTNTPRDYAWGSRTAIASLLGREASGGPEAELWLGAHPESPAIVTDATGSLAGRRLDDLIARDPAAFVGAGRDRLPFLMKVLAADAPLSLQVHPDDAQAHEGFARENEARVKVGAPDRNYRDDSAKPELILALSPTFEALAGFRHVSESRMLLAELISTASGDERAPLSRFADRLAGGDPVATGSTGSSRDVIFEGMPEQRETVPDHGNGGNSLADAVEWLLRGGADVDALSAAIASTAARMPDTSSFAREWETVRDLHADYPGDPGIAISLLLNRISLLQGQALALPAGSLHAYLQGVGIEVMKTSDNVLRGGFTSKHVDVEELLRVVRFETLPSPVERGHQLEAGITVYRGPTDDFVLARLDLGESGGEHGYALAGPEQVGFDLSGPAVALCLSGGATIRGRQGAANLARGDATLVTPDEGHLEVSGSAVVVIATTP